MARRIDYLDDPNAPTPNSLKPSVNVIVQDADDTVLLIRRTDNDKWSLPGGAIDLGETVRQAAVRETLEETGIRCEISGIAGIYSNPRHLVEYTSDGEVRQEFTIVLSGRPVSGKPTASDESSQVAWVPASELLEYDMHPAMRVRIENHLNGVTDYLD